MNVLLWHLFSYLFRILSILQITVLYLSYHLASTMHRFFFFFLTRFLSKMVKVYQATRTSGLTIFFFPEKFPTYLLLFSRLTHRVKLSLIHRLNIQLSSWLVNGHYYVKLLLLKLFPRSAFGQEDGFTLSF